MVHGGTGGRRLRRRTGFIAALAAVALASGALAACGGDDSSSSGSNTTKPPSSTGSNATTASTLAKSTALGTGVTDKTVKIGFALVDFSQIQQFTDTIRTKQEQQQIYKAYIDDINAHGGIAGRTIVPDIKYYSPLGNTEILNLCTQFAQDDKVFAVMGTFVDFSGDAQTCISKQQARPLMTFNLTQAIIDRSPGGMIVTPGYIPERTGQVMITLMKREDMFKGKKVAVLGDTSEATTVNNYIVPALKQAGVPTGSTAILSVGSNGDTGTALSQLESYIERWKTESVNSFLVSGDLASTKQFVIKLKQSFPNAQLMADNTDVLEQARQLQKSNTTNNPYDGIISAAGLSPKEYDASANWKYCAGIYEKATGKSPAPDAESTIKTKDGKIDDTYGTINDACQLLSMFHDIGERVGKYLDNTNWINAVNTYGHIENRGSGPYSSLHQGKYTADDNWRLQSYDPTLGETGNWKPITPLENISNWPPSS